MAKNKTTKEGKNMSTEFQKDVEQLKKDLAKFRDDLGTRMSEIGNYSHDKVLQTRNNLKESINAFEGYAYNKMKEANEYAHEKGERMVEGSREMVQQKPLMSLAISFGAGIIAAMLLKRGKNE